MPEPRQRPSRTFELLVNDDLRDQYAAGSAYEILSRRENLVSWLWTLDSIVESIKAQDAHEKALLDSHPDKPVGGGPTPESYVEAKRSMLERKARRDRKKQAVIYRMNEVRRLISTAGLSTFDSGDVIGWLLIVRNHLAKGQIEDAASTITDLIDGLTPQAGSDA